MRCVPPQAQYSTATPVSALRKPPAWSSGSPDFNLSLCLVDIIVECLFPREGPLKERSALLQNSLLYITYLPSFAQ